MYEGASEKILKQLIGETHASAVFFHESYEHPIRKRDQALVDSLQKEGVDVRSFEGRLLFHPEQIKTKTDDPYKVFTPFWKYCATKTDTIEAPLSAPRSVRMVSDVPQSIEIDALGLLPKIKWDDGFYKEWDVGEKAAHERLAHFMEKKLQHYTKGRDFPAKGYISKLSPYLHFGQISPRVIWHKIRDYVQTVAPEKQTASDKFLAELGWREFSAYLLYHFPAMQTKPFRGEFTDFPWTESAEFLSAWQQGKTGYPLVDAGMRELWQTGFMHNRVRMVVGSFLIKHLGIHWKDGEAWFWDCLVDADHGSNIASWQWVAGCGADAAPYFRIFNPILQSKKFDTEADYIRTYVPELAKLGNDKIHTPWEADIFELKDAGIELGKTYPHPIVDHDKARKKALAAYQEIK